MDSIHPQIPAVPCMVDMGYGHPLIPGGAVQIPGPWTLLGIYTGKWFTLDEFNLLKTAGSAYHNRIFEFKLPPSLQRKRGRGRPDLEPASCFCDATEAGNATREINHFAALDDEGADTAGSPGHRSASARFVETIDDRAGLPYVLLFSTRAMHVEEEVTIDYGPSFFDAMQNTEEVESLKGKLKETERQLKVALEQLQAKDQQLKELLMAPRPQPMLLPDPGDVLQVRGPESRQALVNNCRCAPSGGLPCSYNCQCHVLYI